MTFRGNADVIRCHIDHVLAALPDGMTLASWYMSGARLEDFDHGQDSHDEAVFALGYLYCAADERGMSVLELVDLFMHAGGN